MTKDEAIKLVKRSIGNFHMLDESFRNDKDVVLTAVKISGYQLKFASKEMQNDKEIAIAAIKRGGYKYINEELENDKEVLEAINEYNRRYRTFYGSSDTKREKAIYVMCDYFEANNEIKTDVWYNCGKRNGDKTNLDW